MKQYVYKTNGLKRYRFPTHENDLVVDRSGTARSEVFVVVLQPGEAPPLHKHDDTEQIFYVLEGKGRLTIGKGKGRTASIEPGDVVVVPPGTWHSVRSARGMRYLAIDCFGSPESRLEPTWDEHVKAVCKLQGWDYGKVVI